MERETIIVLHVEPDATTRLDVAEGIEAYDDMEMIGAESIEEGVEKTEGKAVDCVIADYELPDGNAFDLFTRLRESNPDTACILYTDTGFGRMDTDAIDETVVEYLSKRIPGTEERLPDLIRSIVADRLQVGYPVPDREAERLEAVDRYDLPELASTEAFDRLTALVQAYFDVDVAFVGLMKSHEEDIVACQGSQWSMLDRENTVCTYALLESDVTVIEDTQEDPRFEHNDRLRELGVRSYAGANLATADGRVLGELCLIDGEPRSYDVEERNLLQMFADEVVEQMELRRRLSASEKPVNVGE